MKNVANRNASYPREDNGQKLLKHTVNKPMQRVKAFLSSLLRMAAILKTAAGLTGFLRGCILSILSRILCFSVGKRVHGFSVLMKNAGTESTF